MDRQDAARQMMARVVDGVASAATSVAAAADASRVLDHPGMFDDEEAVRAMVSGVFHRVVRSDSVALDVDTGTVHFLVANESQKLAVEGLVHSMVSGILEKVAAASEVREMGTRLLEDMGSDTVALGDVLCGVKVGEEVHGMVFKIFAEVVAGRQAFDGDGAEHDLVASSLEKLTLDGCEYDKDDEALIAATEPLIRCLVSRIVRKVVEAGREPAYAGEQEKRSKELNDVKEIVRLCREKYGKMAKEVPPFFHVMAYFQIRAAYMQYPEMSSAALPKESFTDYLNGCVERLCRENSPAQATIKLQISAKAAMNAELEKMKIDAYNRKEVLRDIAKCAAEIKINELRRTFQIVEELHSQVLSYIIHYNMEIEDSFIEGSITEIRVAFESIFPQATCLLWLDHPKAEKVIQVEEMAAVVTGIRVFNKSLGRGGQTFDLPFGHYKDEMKSLSEMVMHCLQQSNEKAQRCAEAIQAHFESAGMRHVLLQRLRDELAYNLQAFALLERLQSLLTERFGVVREHDDKCCEHLKILYDAIGARSCIANELVYPHFQAVGRIVKSVAEELKVLRSYAKAAVPLLTMVSQPLFTSTPSGIASVCTSTGLSKLDTLMNYSTFLPPEIYTVNWNENDRILSEVDASLEPSGEVLRDEDVENALQDVGVLQLSGYCPVSLAEHRGLLLHGDPDIGLVRVDGKLYAFSKKTS